jgi:hypothetical protein
VLSIKKKISEGLETIRPSTKRSAPNYLIRITVSAKLSRILIEIMFVSRFTWFIIVEITEILLNYQLHYKTHILFDINTSTILQSLLFQLP